MARLEANNLKSDSVNHLLKVFVTSEIGSN